MAAPCSTVIVIMAGRGSKQFALRQKKSERKGDFGSIRDSGSYGVLVGNTGHDDEFRIGRMLNTWRREIW